MTMSDDLHYKLANVTEALAKERTRCDKLANEADYLRWKLEESWQGNRILRRENDQLREQLRRDERPMQRLEDDHGEA